MSLSELIEVHGPNSDNGTPIRTENLGIFFTISESHNAPLFYKSSICSNIQTPSWSCSDIALLSKTHLLSPTFIFQFFLTSQLNQSKVKLLEALISFSDLRNLGADPILNTVFANNSKQLVFRCGKIYLSWPYRPSDCSNVYLMQIFREPVKSYDIVRIRRILQLEEMISNNRTAFIRAYDQLILAKKINTRLSYEAQCIAQVQTQITILRGTLLEARANKQKLKTRFDNYELEKKSLCEKENDMQRMMENFSTKYLEVLQQTNEMRTLVSKLQNTLEIRKYYMVQELSEIFPIETIPENLKNTFLPTNEHRLTICQTLLVASDAPGISSAPIVSWKDSGDGLQPKPASIADNQGSVDGQGFVESGNISKLTLPALTLRLSNKTHTASVGLGYVASLLCLLSVIYGIPLRYPINLEHGINFTSIKDVIITSSPDQDQNFPLYVQRTKSLHLYQYGVFLLNRNVHILRSFFGLKTKNHRATLWNLRHLLDARLLKKDHQ